MNDLQNIGFYTLNDERVANSNKDSQLMRCELLLTDLCNFKCPYCNGMRSDCKGTYSFERAKEIVDLWTADNLKNIRLSGGEPTLWKDLPKLVSYIKEKGVERIAISTNGYADFELYQELIDAGINDFSISLDACCASFGDMMAGGIDGAWEKVIENIKKIAKQAYTTLGVVVTEETVSSLNDTILFCDTLGVQDIRIISSSHYNTLLEAALEVDEKVYSKYPILSYRINNIKNKRNVRGLQERDARRCSLVLDDMAIAGDFHFPCIIYMREQGDPIGKVSKDMREERFQWHLKHNCYKDEICKNNCLDVCIDFNNQHDYYKIKKQTKLKPMDSSLFTKEIWDAGSVHSMGVEHFRFDNLQDHKQLFLDNAIGYAFGENLPFRLKDNEVAIMFETDKKFWFHIRRTEFVEIFCK